MNLTGQKEEEQFMRKKGRDTYGSFAYSSDDVRASGRVPNRRNGFGRK